MEVEKKLHEITHEYPVNERFFTFQGEGCHMGKPAFFVRLHGCPVHCPWCFAEGTRLHTSRGRIDISKIKVGDLVWSFNEITQQQEFTEVLAIEDRLAVDYFELRWESGSRHSARTVKVTGEHPFWVVGRGWTAVENLTASFIKFRGNGQHQINSKSSDVLLEVDQDQYLSELRRMVSSNQSKSRRKMSSRRMRLRNPMESKTVRQKVSSTLKHKIRSGEIENQFVRMWNRKSFQTIVRNRMINKNPNQEPEAHAKSCYRPFGKTSKIEFFVAKIIHSNKLPFIHNKGQIVIGGRVPDFVCEKKKKVIEVTHSTYLNRERDGYHEQNWKFYEQHGYECLTLYTRPSIENERRVLGRITEFAYNGRKLLCKAHINEPIRVYSIRTANHTFFAEDVLTHNCDSAGTWHPQHIPKHIQRLSPAQIVREIQSSGAHFVVITGGEPAIHDLADLTIACHEQDIACHLETSGAFPIHGAMDWVTLSPKKWKEPIRSNVVLADEFKFIIEQPSDIGMYLQMIRDLGYRTQSPGEFGLKEEDIPIWLHPEWSHRNDMEVLHAISEAVKKAEAPFRAGWQLHKLYRVDEVDSRSRPAVPLGGDPSKGF